MGSVSHVLFLLLFIFISIFLFSNLHLMSGAWTLKYKPHKTDDDNVLVDMDGDGKENKIEVVSGEDESGEMGMLVLEKFRFLLGLKSYYYRRQLHGHEDQWFSPAPAPFDSLTRAPAPLFPTHIPHLAPSPHLKLILPPPPQNSAVQGRKQSEGRVRRIVIAVVVSVGSTSVIAAVVVILICWRHVRSRPKRSGRTMLVTGIGGVSGRHKIVNASTSTNKVSFDPGPELFYLNSLGTFPEGVSCSKRTCQTVNVPSNEIPTDSPLHEADDESFHSVCNSHSSNARFSNASEANFGNPSVTSSPSYLSKRSPSPDHNSTAETTISTLRSPTRPITPDTSPLHHLSLQSSPSSPSYSSNQTQTMASFLSSMSRSSPDNANNSWVPSSPSAPDLTPPVPSNEQPSPSLSTSCSVTQMPLGMPCSPRINPNNVLSSPSRSVHPLNSDSSSKEIHLASHPPSVPLSTPLQKPSQSSATQVVVPGSIPKPPCPPLSLLQPPLLKGCNSNRPPPPPHLLPPPFLKGRSSSQLPPPPPLLQPPFLNGRNSRQPPPPPPFQGEQFIAVGKDGAPLPKLKPLHWDKVRAAPDRSMVWDKLRSSSFELDEEMIESLFGYNLQNSMKNEEAKSKSPSPSKHVLDPKRLQNITILSKALNATSEQVCHALMQGDGLRAQQLEALAKMMPTKEEEDKLSNYQGNINELGSAEKFVKTIINIPFAFQRIEAMLYRDTFEDEVVHLRKSFAMLEEACKELRSSRLFLKLLEAVLKTGNRMNVGTIRGGARAFKLDTLLKLSDVKGTDGKTTLLHFVVQEMIRSEGIELSENAIENGNHKNRNRNKSAEEWEEDYKIMGLDLVSGLSTELDNVKKTATIDLDVLASSVSNLSDGMVKMQNLIQKDLLTDNKNMIFIHSMKSFLNHAEKDIKELKEDEYRVFLNVREITEYFHGDVSKDEANPLRIFVIVRDFLGMLDRVCKEVRSLRIQSSPNSVVPFRYR
ncbi:formin-like protein 11 isoform X2 [Magnolia sinica]|uniref:formin-like protein 11 isoform X2 n=1 Tax=Magnolia sinica TaxID=86752 RepID=UPI002658E243|nr:formin-like protein 11 isoform X2 [Magnolia sinica]